MWQQKCFIHSFQILGTANANSVSYIFFGVKIETTVNAVTFHRVMSHLIFRNSNSLTLFARPI